MDSRVVSSSNDKFADRSHLSYHSDPVMYPPERENQVPWVVSMMQRNELFTERSRRLLELYLRTSRLKGFHRSEDVASRSDVRSNDIVDRFKLLTWSLLCLLTFKVFFSQSLVLLLPIVIPILVPLYRSWSQYLLDRMPEGIDERLCSDESLELQNDYVGQYLAYRIGMSLFNVLTVAVISVPFALDWCLNLTLPALLHSLVYDLFGNYMLMPWILPAIYGCLILLLNKWLVSILRLALLKRRLEATELIRDNLNRELKVIDSRELVWNLICQVIPLALLKSCQYKADYFLTNEESRVYATEVDNIRRKDYDNYLYLKRNQLIQRNCMSIKVNLERIREGRMDSDHYPFRPSAHYRVINEITMPRRYPWRGPNSLGITYLLIVSLYMLLIFSTGPLDWLINLLPTDSTGLIGYYRS